MRNLCYILFIILTGCQTDGQFRIQGQLPDKTYDGEVIYLVPLENAVKEKVDSAFIVNGMFQIKGVANSAEIYIIRPKPALRLKLQELLVVKEPGELTVRIGPNSMVRGTALNDSLQYWKEKKLMADHLHEELKQKFSSADSSEQTVIKQTADSLNLRIVDFHYNFARNNQDNVVGKFVAKLMGNSFTPEQKKNLNLK
ncbi:MAG: DUF4369 domain-containing protein [Bacteroidota bacterium]|nr:DUF4369 domain-containing protein [Bacteroidota bacterium]